MAIIPTVKIKAGEGWRLINKADFDPDIHELYEETDGNVQTEADAETDPDKKEDGGKDPEADAETDPKPVKKTARKPAARRGAKKTASK